MTSFAIISDVHANAHALNAVLEEIHTKGIRQVYCLGDIVGYNALPHETIELLIDQKIPTIKGNHDMMATEEIGLNKCGPNARVAMLWTRSVLYERDKDFLKRLHDHLVPDPHVLMMHSKLGDPIGYLRTPACYLDHYQHIRKRFPEIRICFTGHTHVRRIIEITETEDVREITSDSVQIHSDRFYFVNPGSVGHPRRSDYRASYAVLEEKMRTVRFFRTGYEKQQMTLVNKNHNIHTNLGPGPLRYWVDQTIGLFKRVVRRRYER